MERWNAFADQQYEFAHGTCLSKNYPVDPSMLQTGNKENYCTTDVHTRAWCHAGKQSLSIEEVRHASHDTWLMDE